MSDNALFDYEEAPTSCAHCGRRLANGKCPWCDVVPLPNTNPKKIARRGGPATSRAGAEAIRYRTGTQKAIILAEYAAAGESGLTDEEVASILGEVEVNKIRKRCSDLRNEGMIAPLPNGETRTGKSGVANLVCAITDRGIATHAPMKENDARPDDAPVPVPPYRPHGDGLPNANACLLCGSLNHRTIHHSARRP